MRFFRSGDDAARLLPVSVEEWEQRARAKLAAGPFDYVAGAAGGGNTLRANLEAFQQWRLLPRVCCDISKRDLTCRLFGRDLPVPFLLAPVGVLSILHRDAELAPASAAAELGVPYILSNVSTKSMEAVAEANQDGVRWFQLYPPKDRELTRSFLRRAEAAGYSAIVVTLDSPLLGWRERDLQNGYLPFLNGDGMGNYFTDPVFCAKLEKPPSDDQATAIKLALTEGNNTCFSWDEVAFICKETRLPVLLKGLTHPEDARLAVQHGVAGVVVSNHGGRQIDGAIATLDALPAVCDAVGDQVPVLMDSGIRRGADLIKALALGATAVLVGRPYAYALAVAGQKGVKEFVEDFVAEVELQLALCGKARVRDLSRSAIVRAGPLA